MPAPHRYAHLVRPAGPAPLALPDEWSLAGLAGRLSELSGGRAGAALSVGFGLVHEAQRLGEPVAFIADPQSSFFPPDAAECGVDLEALIVVRAPAGQGVARAADQLARSGAFGLLLLDLTPGGVVSPALQSRLLGLAQKHDTAVVFLTTVSGASLGSLISLRAVVSHAGRDAEGGFVCELVAVKDKRRAPGWTHREVHRGPTGLR